eukprot:TRINITY_DN42621_c0_g2_i1.p1 TRINITY_DN42621_c0_g2~~TRINITY_DN42621_c0_g2_i1.p1  ORF type:complete len:275 (+),score=58.51 TRINITY_DN42621_c0_g2_i1:110-826(+)
MAHMMSLSPSLNFPLLEELTFNCFSFSGMSLTQFLGKLPSLHLLNLDNCEIYELDSIGGAVPLNCQLSLTSFSYSPKYFSGSQRGLTYDGMQWFMSLKHLSLFIGEANVFSVLQGLKHVVSHLVSLELYSTFSVDHQKCLALFAEEMPIAANFQYAKLSVESHELIPKKNSVFEDVLLLEGLIRTKLPKLTNCVVGRPRRTVVANLLPEFKPLLDYSFIIKLVHQVHAVSNETDQQHL